MEMQELNLNKRDLKENEPLKAEISGKEFVIILHDGSVYALDEHCTHEGGPLHEGHVDGEEIICPWHSGAFQIKTGKANENTPWATDTHSYKIEEDAEGNLSIYA